MVPGTPAACQEQFKVKSRGLTKALDILNCSLFCEDLLNSGGQEFLSPGTRVQGVTIFFLLYHPTPPTTTTSTIGLQGETQCLQWRLESPTLNLTCLGQAGASLQGQVSF